MKPRAIIYVLQSVARDESISPELQESACRDYAARKGYVVTCIESDLGISGHTWKRPAVVRVMEAIEAKEADVILLWKWSRLSRSRCDWAVAIDRCEVAGGRIESSTEELDTSTTTGRLARGMMVEFAAFESERIGDTWREAHERRIKQGKSHRPIERFGYTKTSDGAYTPDPATAPVVHELYARFIAGDSFQRLATWLANEGHRTRRGNAFTATSLLQMLDKPFYAGKIMWHGNPIEGEHPPLIDDPTWQAYRDARGTRRVNPDSVTKRRPTLLGGIIRCSCGATMLGHAGATRKWPRYECNTTHQAVPCTAEQRSVDLNAADAAVSEWIQSVAEQIDEAVDVDVTPESNAIVAKLRETNEALTRLTVEYAKGIIPEAAYSAASAALVAEQRGLEREASGLLRRAGRARVDAKLLLSWDSLDVGQRRALLHELVERVEWSGPRGKPKVFRIFAK